MKARKHIEAFLADVKVRAFVARELREALANCAKRLDPATVEKVREAFAEACPYIEDPLATLAECGIASRFFS